MPILYGAVAYREDLLEQFRSEIASWDLTRTYQHPIGCPAGCDKTYRLIVEINASDEKAKEYVDLVHKGMEHSGCKEHAPYIRMNAHA